MYTVSNDIVKSWGQTALGGCNVYVFFVDAETRDAMNKQAVVHNLKCHYAI